MRDIQILRPLVRPLLRSVATGDVAAPLKGGIHPPSGFVFLIDADGAYLTDPDGTYYVEAL